MKDKNDLKLLDIMCKWYIWAVVGLVIGNWLSDTLESHIGLAFGSLIGWYIQKNYNKKDNGQLPVYLFNPPKPLCFQGKSAF